MESAPPAARRNGKRGVEKGGRGIEEVGCGLAAAAVLGLVVVVVVMMILRLLAGEGRGNGATPQPGIYLAREQEVFDRTDVVVGILEHSRCLSWWRHNEVLLY